MKNAKEKCNNAIGMAAIWTIVFAVMLICFVNWGSVFAAIIMVFSYFKVLSYAHQAGFHEANYKMLETVETITNSVISKKGRLSEDVRGKSTNNNQTEPFQTDDRD